MHNAQQILQVVATTFQHFVHIDADSALCTTGAKVEEVKLACMWAMALDIRHKWQEGQATVNEVVEALLRVTLSCALTIFWVVANLTSSHKRHKMFWQRLPVPIT